MERRAQGIALAALFLVSVSMAAACTRPAPASPPAVADTPLPTPVPLPTALPSPTPLPEGLAVPPGPAPRIDGVLDPAEWEAALRVRLSDGSTLLLMQDGSYLYLGVHAAVPGLGVSSVCLDRGQQVAILHASAALGTALYERSEADLWTPTRTFSWSCRETEDTPAARQERQAFLEREGWVASNGTMGIPGQMEFQIAVPAGPLRLSVAYMGAATGRSPAWWPPEESDDCRQRDFVSGDRQADLRFDPDTWATLVLDPTPMRVERGPFFSAEGVTLTGTLFGGGGPADAAVLLAHMGGRDQRDWEEFARLLARSGLPAFTFDFRCHGQSGCDVSTDLAHLADLRAALTLLRERGYRRIVCVGASLGAAACARAALFEELAGLAFLGGPEVGTIAGREYPRDLVSPAMPKLFVVSEFDSFSAARTAVRDLYLVSPEPRALEVFPGTAHGTDMLAADYGGQLRDLLVSFLQEALQ